MATVTSRGKVRGIRGSLLEAEIPQAGLGHLCEIQRQFKDPLLCEVVSFHEHSVLLAPYEEPFDVLPGDRVICHGEQIQVDMPIPCEGAVVNARGVSIDTKNTPFPKKKIPAVKPPPASLIRKPITEILPTGVSAIDGLCTLGKGQRIGLFSGAGAGKSTLLSMLARNTSCDITVIALIGERGREVGEFLETLGKDGRKKSCLVVSTSDESPLQRILAALTATSIAEEHRKDGKSVLLLFDSLTRYARAVRDLALSRGDLPVRHGYPAAVYSSLPKLIERAGNDSAGSITAVYTVLTNGESYEDPLGEEVKSLLDGHICLSHKRAEQGIRPAIDINNSISRLNNRLHTKEILDAQRKIRRALFRLDSEKEILSLGGIPDAELSVLLQKEEEILNFLNQGVDCNRSFETTLETIRYLIPPT